LNPRGLRMIPTKKAGREFKSTGAKREKEIKKRRQTELPRGGRLRKRTGEKGRENLQ